MSLYFLSRLSISFMNLYQDNIRSYLFHTGIGNHILFPVTEKSAKFTAFGHDQCLNPARTFLSSHSRIPPPPFLMAIALMFCRNAPFDHSSKISRIYRCFSICGRFLSGYADITFSLSNAFTMTPVSTPPITSVSTRVTAYCARVVS